MKIRCMIAHKKDLWVAVSLDFGLSAQANSKKEAMGKLNGQIEEYLHDAMGEDIAFQYKLLKRKGPISWFMIYYYTLLKASIIHSGSHILFCKNTSDYISHA